MTDNEKLSRFHKTRRDDQQWLLDLALNTRGRVQNFELDERETPPNKRARNYRMYSKVWREAADRHRVLADEAERTGHRVTAVHHLDNTVEALRMAQHPIYFDDHPVKLALMAQLDEAVDRRAVLAPYRLERLEVPFDGQTISCLIHLAPSVDEAPCVIYVPGMDQTKEVMPKHLALNPAVSRGMHLVTMDGPGQGSSNRKKIRAIDDNYERAVAAVFDAVAQRAEVDEKRIALYGISMGSYWAVKAASRLENLCALAAGVACFDPTNTIFKTSSPRFKQMFMYMAGIDNEDDFDRVASTMNGKEAADQISVPTLLATGEFDPLAPLEDTLEVYERLSGPKELWAFEDQYHPLWSIENLGGLGVHEYAFDWLAGALNGSFNQDRMAYASLDGSGPFSEDAEWTPPVRHDQPYF